MSLFEEVAQAFKAKVRKDRKSGRPYIKIAGPGHSGADDSLTVWPSEKGDDIFVHSHSGDAWAGAKDWVYEQVGRKPENKQAFLKQGKSGNGNGHGKGGGIKTLVAEYVYATAEGKPYLKVKKFISDELDKKGKPKKSFYQEHWTGTGWAPGKPDGAKIPFRLPELINSQISIPVYLCEGEKDALALASVGLIATAVSEGASAEWDPALTEHFAGRIVIILPDADVAGRTFAQNAAKALHGTADEIRIFELYPDGEDGEDVSDYLAQRDPTGAQLMLSKIRKQTSEWSLADVKTEEDVVAEELDGLDGIEKARRKKALAGELGITIKELDKALAERDITSQPAHWAVESWTEPVLTGPLLDLLSEVYASRVVMPPHAAEAMALWCLHAWAHEASSATGFLQFVSPVPECGKSKGQEALLWTTPRGVMASNISPSSFFRYVDRDRPTLIIDEAETYVKREDTRGILDGGITRAGAFTIRTIGDSHEPKLFSTYGPKVLGGLGKLAPTIMSRCITIHMKRKKKSEQVIKLRGRDTVAFKAIRSQCCRWRDDNVAKLMDAQPVLPPGLTDRGEDIWEPMFAIAELAGPAWVAKAHAAALAFNGSHDVEDDSLGIQLLAAVRDLIETTKETSSVDSIFSETIAAHLHKDPTGPWLAYGKAQKEISPAQIATLLRPFEIKPSQVRIGATSKKGYEFAAFTSAFDAYLRSPPASLSFQTETPKQTNNDGPNLHFLPETTGENVSGKKSEKTNDNNDVSGVSVQKQGEGPVCDHCGSSDGELLPCSIGGTDIHLHRDCIDRWEASRDG
jgi:putative DNA primase/helicase